MKPKINNFTERNRNLLNKNNNSEIEDEEYIWAEKYENFGWQFLVWTEIFLSKYCHSNIVTLIYPQFHVFDFAKQRRLDLLLWDWMMIINLFLKTLEMFSSALVAQVKTENDHSSVSTLPWWSENLWLFQDRVENSTPFS